MPFNVLVTAPVLGPRGLEKLQGAGCRVLFVKKGHEELERLMAAEPIDAVISRTLELDAAAIKSCPSLRVISKHGAGVNNIDVEAATQSGIPVFYTPGANAQSVAELTIGLMLAVARKISFHDKALHDGGWTRSNDGLQLEGRTLGLIGVGDIGGRVGQLARAFGMSVIGYDPFVQTAPAFEMVSSLDKLLAASDFVSIHSPLTAETKGMIGTRELRLMRPTSILVNTSRGGIVDEMALAAALENKIIGGAALDVFSTEPPAAASPLLKLPNLVMTPHVGGSTYEALDAVAAAAADTAIQYLSGGVVDPTLCINPIALQTKS